MRNLLHSPPCSTTRNCAVIGRVKYTADWLRTLECDWFMWVRV